MKKTIFLTLFLTLLIIFTPAFMVRVPDENVFEVSEKRNEIDKSYKYLDNKEEEVVSTFSSNTCFKKTYYINKDKVKVYDNPYGKNKVNKTLNKNDVVVAYKDEDGYIYCEDNNGNFGWIEKNSENLSGDINIETKYLLDVNLTKQNISVYQNHKLIKTIKCSTGKFGNADTETPVGFFKIQTKGEKFFSQKYGEGGKYYIKFFSNYLIHSVPIDKNNNIIKEEEKKIGLPSSHGCIRVPLNEAKWLYKNIPGGSVVKIHY